MDAIVQAALRKWPNVPHCHGWLALDARGDWYMRDERVQSSGPFPQSKGSVIRHEKLREFIHRNYSRDAEGAAFFQNGPQRVYVDLEAAPYIWRVQGDGAQVTVTSHTGEPTLGLESAWLDEMGRLYLSARLATVGAAFGIVHTQDMVQAAQAVDEGLWQPQCCVFEQMPARFRFVRRPRPPAGGSAG